jgi:hypothetical protein
LAGGRSGCEGDACVGAPGRTVCGRGCDGTLGKLGAAGRGAPGAITAEGATFTEGGFKASPIPLGRGCLGPDKI